MTYQIEVVTVQPDGSRSVEVHTLKGKLPRLAKSELMLWCDCGEDQSFGSYPGDGECDCGVYKHHVHCGTCGKISQVG